MATKKELQEQENAEVAYIYGVVSRNIKNHGLFNPRKLRSCNAVVYDTYGFTVLKSYNTIVACVDRFGYGYDFLRLVYGYTATSTQHISKFFKDYDCYVKYTWRGL